MTQPPTQHEPDLTVDTVSSLGDAALPKVAIVGRPNVGKSSLLNMLAGRRISIVDPTAGVTRDRVPYVIELPPTVRGQPARHCEMIDTGGYGVYSGEGELELLTEDVERQITAALNEAQLVLFVVDALMGITSLDKQFASVLRRQMHDTRKIVLVANKVDHSKYVADAQEATELGFGEPLTVSANTKFNKYALIETITERLDFTGTVDQAAESEMLLAIVGKRNAGKSTLVNALAGVERVIVSELPGTTRDSVDVRFVLDGRQFTAIDTAGVRKRKSMADDLEYYSYHRALRSIRRADVVMLLIDAAVPISQVDKKLSSEIQLHFKPCVIVLNKWDLLQNDLKTDDYLEYMEKALRGLDYAPIVFASAKHNDHVVETVHTAQSLYEQATQRVGTGELNQVMRDILEKRGPSGRLGRQAKIYYVTQVSVAPPTIAMFVNHVELFDEQYQRYIINSFRERLPFAEVPIRLAIRPRQRDRDVEPVAEA